MREGKKKKKKEGNIDAKRAEVKHDVTTSSEKFNGTALKTGVRTMKRGILLKVVLVFSLKRNPNKRERGLVQMDWKTRWTAKAANRARFRGISTKEEKSEMTSKGKEESIKLVKKVRKRKRIVNTSRGKS